MTTSIRTNQTTSTGNTGNSGGPLTVAVPSSMIAGDIIILVVAYANTNPAITFTPPSQFVGLTTLVQGDVCTFIVYYATATGTESGNFSVTVNGITSSTDTYLLASYSLANVSSGTFAFNSAQNLVFGNTGLTASLTGPSLYTGADAISGTPQNVFVLWIAVSAWVYGTSGSLVSVTLPSNFTQPNSTAQTPNGNSVNIYIVSAGYVEPIAYTTSYSGSIVN